MTTKDENPTIKIFYVVFASNGNEYMWFKPIYEKDI
jgi:hypothetical protein